MEFLSQAFDKSRQYSMEGDLISELCEKSGINGPAHTLYFGVKLINCVEIISRLGIIIIKSTSLSNKFLH
jgi:hypothetical protein